MFNRFGFSLAFFTACFAFSNATAQEIWTTRGFKNPESVVFDTERRNFYVSNVDGEPLCRDGAGHISRLNSEGAMQEAEWVTGLNAPKGLALAGDILYVSDIDRLVAIDIASAAIVSSWTAEDAQFLNDVAVSNDGRVFVSDMLGDAIYVLEDDALSVWLQGEGLQHPNGLKIADGNLIVAAWGRDLQEDFSTLTLGHLLAVDLESKEIAAIGSGRPVGNLDGLEPDGQGNWLVTDWLAGKLFRIYADGSFEILLHLFPGSADLEVLDREGHLAIIPMMNDNLVTAHRIQ